jgi:hypothetical protein
MAIKAQGTEVFFIDPVGDVVTKVVCATAITGLTAARDQIETTCLDDQARTYEAGLATPGAAQVTIAADPAEPSHVRLHELYVEGITVPWAIGWSDGMGIAPTADSSDFVLPATRSWVTFEGYISDYPFEFALNSMVTSTMAIQVSNFPVWTPKTA